MLALADQLEKLCCAETEGKFFDCVTDNIQTIIASLRHFEAAANALSVGKSSDDQEFTRAVETAQQRIGDIWSASAHDKIIKHLMADVGMPNSHSLHAAFKQFANELNNLSRNENPQFLSYEDGEFNGPSEHTAPASAVQGEFPAPRAVHGSAAVGPPELRDPFLHTLRAPATQGPVNRDIFKFADSLDWDFIEQLLSKSVRHDQDQQTKFWVSIVRDLRQMFGPPTSLLKGGGK